jgi:FtsH-binding integral membrane protein
MPSPLPDETISSRVKAGRPAYYLTFAAIGLFCATDLTFRALGKPVQDASLVQLVSFGLISTTAYITKADKAYLIRAIPLRILMGGSAIAALASFVLSIRS